FRPSFNPYEYEHSDIDVGPPPPQLRNPAVDYFTLFEFSAKWDPVPTMLTQNHVATIKGFIGQTTAFRKALIKEHVVVLAEAPGRSEVKYLHGAYGEGTFTFYAGHDPEDYQHYVGDPPTDLNLHKNSPGYRLILNNILFPAAKKKKQKT
ncbi:MAG: asparagine synthetase B, partial [Bacteroidetes bacterium]